MMIAKFFARIHETSLMKQGMLAWTFNDRADHDRIEEGDQISVLSVPHGLLESKDVIMEVTRRDGRTWSSELQHTYSGE